MFSIHTMLRLLLGMIAAAAAIGIAMALGGPKEHLSEGSGALYLAAGLVAGSMLHVPSHVVTWLVDALADRLDQHLETMSQNKRPAGNADAQRAGRKAALRGLAYTLNYFLRSARSDPSSYDLAQVKAFRRNALAWVGQQQAAVQRKDRPQDAGWQRRGMSLDAVSGAYGSGTAEPKSQALDELAWAEFTAAMIAQNVAIPEPFRAFFAGEEFCGPGWRRAGHLYFMRELKRSHDAEVGYLVESVNSLRADLREILGRLSPDAPEG